MKHITSYSLLLITIAQILPLGTTKLKSSKSSKNTIQNYTLQPQSNIQNNELHCQAWSKNKGGGMFLEKQLWMT